MQTLQQIENALSQCIKGLPAQVGQLAVNFSKQCFLEQGWESPGDWTPRKNRRRGGKARQKGAVLVDSGRLKRSIRIVSVGVTSVTIGTDVPYARIHNDGFDGTQQVRPYAQHVKAHQRRQKVNARKGGKKIRKVSVRPHTRHIKAHARKMHIPRRRFIGDNERLSRQIAQFISSEINSIIESIR